MMLEGDIEKLRGTLEFQFNSQVLRESGALLSFHNRNGVSLEWSGTEAPLDQLQAITGDFIFKVFIPELRVVHSQIDGGGSHYRGNGAQLFTSFDDPDPRGQLFTTVRINMPLLHEYIGVSVPSWKSQVDYGLSYEWVSSNIKLGDAFPQGSSISVHTSAIADNDQVTGVSLRPRPQLIVEFASPISFDSANTYATSLRALFEMLSSRPTSELTTRFYKDESCVVLRESIDKRSPGTRTSGPLSLRYKHCGSHLATMIGPWLTEMGRSPAVDNLLRLLYYPDLPIDLRYFMAFSALGYLNVEQSHGGKHRAKIKEIEHLQAFESWWKILVPNTSQNELEKYLTRIANTRHNVAHLSRPNHEVLSGKKDLLRGFNQLHVLARASLFKNLGLPPQECERYIQSLSQYLTDHFDSVPTNLLT